MATPSHNGHAAPLATLAIRPATLAIRPATLAIRPATRSAITLTPYSASSTPGPRSDAPIDRYQGTLRGSSFWLQDGMDTFFDWITDPHNHERLYKKNPVSGQKPTDIRQEIASVVNRKHNTKWTELQVKSKIAYVRAKYREAAKLNPTGQGAQVTAKQLEVCPEFTRLYGIYGESLTAISPPSKQSIHLGDERTASEITEDESCDLEPQEDNSDADLNADTQVKSSYVPPPNKRARGNSISNQAMLTTPMEKIQQPSDQSQWIYETRVELRQREQVVETRERELMRFAEETTKRLGQELSAERAEFRKERAEFRKEMAEERAELRREKAEFAMERDRLKMENAALRKELELRTVRSS